MVATIWYSYKYYPLHFSFTRPVLGEGMGMVRLGIAFVVAGVFGSGAEFVIRSYLSHTSSLDIVGFYNAGYVITMTYASMVFSAMETDYFPRLSSISETGEKLNLVANRQIEVSILLLAPLLTFFMVFMPILLPLLYSSKFVPVINMAQIAIFSMYMRAVYLPVEYISLSRRDSRAYLIQEAFSALIMAVCVMVGYRLKGLDGTGLGLTISATVEMAFVLLYTKYRYRYVVSRNVVLFLVCQLAIGASAYGTTFVANKVLHLFLSGIFIVASCAISFSFLKKKTHFGHYLKSKYSK
jgi:O-antigen/teichoic acid export membrane protein